MTWKQELLSVEFVDRLWSRRILILTSERFGASGRKFLVEMFASHPKVANSLVHGDGPFWRVRFAAVQTEAMEPVFEPSLMF